MCLSLGAEVSSCAQKYEPRTTWPYLFEKFQTADFVTVSNRGMASKDVNISIADGKLHYLDNGVIMAADLTTVAEARVGDDRYVNVWGRMMKVVAAGEHGIVVRETVADLDKMAKTDIGYGISSATASSQSLSSLLGDGSADMVNTDVTSALAKRGEGEVIPLRENLYLKVGNDVVPATKKDVVDLPAVSKEDAQAFFKTRKVKWNDPSSLVWVVEFIYEQNNEK